ncbi:DUF4221 domain-containing protein [Neolewinella aurantiaca]|uniref:DUF4221 domain-containing protein n=1 Tax=Neolewinella aurantiaca TaxID=2602767 RepID=A0A5C7FGR2_9BACT|nr:DUF4221 family protein [Neolewinella aurantiaca]TXF90170.1 DUF4221 domain-containing protein [Neolewinella aurantiaca]
MLKKLCAFFVSVLIISCGRGKGDDMGVKELYGSVAVNSCMTMRPDFTFNYQNISGFSKSNVNGDVYLTSLSSDEIYTFEAETGLLVNKRKLEKEGPFAIGSISSFDGVYYMNKDSILYSSNSQNKIFLLTPSAVEVVVDFSNVSNVRLASAFRNAPVEGKNHILFPIYPNTKEDIGKGFAFVAIRKDLKGYDQVVDFAPAYDGKFYGTTPYFYWPSVTFNSESDSYIASFPVSHAVFEYDSRFKLKKKHNTYHEIIGPIEEFPYALDPEGNPSRGDDGIYYRETNHFCNIYYLYGKDVYFRFGIIADPENNERELCVFVYNNDFTQSKTLKLSADYVEGSMFALDDKMFILNETKLISERTVKLPYDCFTFEPN